MAHTIQIKMTFISRIPFIEDEIARRNHQAHNLVLWAPDLAIFIPKSCALKLTDTRKIAVAVCWTVH